MEPNTLANTIQSFEDLRILVVGDVMIDAYLVGRAHRISPEAPVPVVHVGNKDKRLGGAANVGLNLRALGATTFMAGVVGNDAAGSEFTELLASRGIDGSCMVQEDGRQTTIKTRVISNGQQMLRVDEEVTTPISQSTADQLLSNIKSCIEQGLDAIILEDYNKGVLQPEVIRSIIDLASENNVITAVDPKKLNFMDYKGVTLFKPNLKELEAGLNRTVDPTSQADLEQASAELGQALNQKVTLITLSENGVFINRDEESAIIPAHVRNISDVSGAGDTVISVATCCLAKSMPLASIAGIANLAGGLVCEKVGVVPVDKDQLIAEAKNQLNP